jgi:hypothetical protein
VQKEIEAPIQTPEELWFDKRAIYLRVLLKDELPLNMIEY